MKIKVTKDELDLIICALHAVAPHGGGSPQFHLANRLGDPKDWLQVGELQTIAHDEYVDARILDELNEITGN